jgi:hypothetical protein
MILSDYEKAVESALPQVFTYDYQHKGCYFHFSQAVYKRMKEMGMAKSLETSYALYEWFNKLKVLPLVPLYTLHLCLAHLCDFE